MTEYQRNRRLEWHLYESNEGILEHAERIVALEELASDWRELAVGGADSPTDWNHAQAELEQRMRHLGIEVEP